ncbi:MAG: zinc ribbon domain-containing protein [candidate division WOR-3 bacterium]
MYCPTCGLEHVEARRFCNRCGTNLEAVSRTLAGVLHDPMAAAKLDKRQKALSRAFLTFCFGPGFGISMLIIAEVLGSLGAHDIARVAEDAALFGVLLMFVGIVRMINVRILYGRKSDLLEQVRQSQPLMEPTPRQVIQQTTPQVPLEIPLPPSVTESTTFRLEPQQEWMSTADASRTEDEKRTSGERKSLKDRP